MSGILFRGRSRSAGRWLAGWLILELALAMVAVTNPASGLIHHGSWQNRDLAILLVLVTLIVVAIPMHDASAQALGFRFLHRINDTKHRMDETPINGFLTNLSIRAALTTFLLVGLLEAQADYGLVPYKVSSLNWREIWASPKSTTFIFVAAALGLSLVTTMAALLCTDYSLRFAWPSETTNRVKLALRRKAHGFHVISFYCLMWSLAAATALVDYLVCLVTAAVVFVAMWCYYFFPEGEAYATVPDLAGLRKSDALDRLTKAGLGVSGEPEGNDFDLVVGHEPPKDAAVEVGSKVSLSLRAPGSERRPVCGG